MENLGQQVLDLRGEHGLLNASGFLVEKQILVQAVALGFGIIKEIPVRCRYFPEVSSIRLVFGGTNCSCSRRSLRRSKWGVR